MLQPAESAALPLVRGAGGRRPRKRPHQSGQSTRFDFFWSWRRGHIGVKFARFGARDVTLGEALDDELLTAAVRPRDLDAIADPQVAVRFGRLAVDVDLAARARFLRFRARLEEAGDVEPLVETHDGTDSTR